MQTSSSISSSLVAQNDLLQTIASLRAQLAQTQLQLERAHQDPFDQRESRRRASSPFDARDFDTGLGADRSRAHSRKASGASGTKEARPVFRGVSSSNGNTINKNRNILYNDNLVYIEQSGTSSDSLAASPTSYTLKRDKSYNDLKSVMSMPSPSSSNTQFHERKSSLSQQTTNGNGNGPMLKSSARRRSSSTGASSDGGKSVTSSRIPVPILPKGSVGTAAALAGGASPKSPLAQSNTSEDEDEANGTFEGTPPHSFPNRILNGNTNGSSRHTYAVEELDTIKHGPSSSLPPISPNMRIDKSSEGEPPPISLADDKTSRPMAGRTSSSPFFGGSAGFTERHAARVASSQTGSSKVIMALQTDLTNARALLESTKSQLRVSARAVETLTRQIEDQKEGKERMRLESQSMATTLSRRERMLEETLLRARGAESQLKQLVDDHKLHSSDCSKRIRDLEIRVKEAEERRAKAESEYSALKVATSNLGEGWRREVKAFRKEQAAIRLLSEKDANSAKSRQVTVTKLISGRNSAKEDINTALQDAKAWRGAVQKQYEIQLSALSKQNERSETENLALVQRTQEMHDELASYRHAMRTYDQTIHGA